MLKNKVLISLFLLSSLFGAKYLAVIDLEATGVSDTEAKVLTQTLTSRMIELSDYIVVERANIDKILKEQKFQHSGCTDSECAVEIGQLLNADLTVIGTVGKIGSTYSLNTRIINVETGEALKSADFTHKGEIDDLLGTGIESVAHELLGIPYKKKISSGTTSKASSGYGATLEISSDPPGAEIYIGGNYFDNTPLLLEDFPSGEYDISIKLANFKDYVESIKLQPRGNSKISAILECLYTFDCTGECGGSAVVDECGKCDGSGIPEGKCDCDGAVLDECGICGGSGPIGECGCENIPYGACDCKGNKLDCAGVCGGVSMEDECGVCDNDTTNDCDMDCAGIMGGNSIEDCKGVCGGSSIINRSGNCVTPYTTTEIIIETVSIALLLSSILFFH